MQSRRGISVAICICMQTYLLNYWTVRHHAPFHCLICKMLMLTQCWHHSFCMICPLQYKYRINLFLSFGFEVFRVFDSHIRNYRSTQDHWGFFFGGGVGWLNSDLAGVVPRYLPNDRKCTPGWIKTFIFIDEPCAILQKLGDKTTRLQRWIQQTTRCYFSITWVKSM